VPKSSKTTTAIAGSTTAKARNARPHGADKKATSRKAAQKQNQPRTIISIDFGTTYSGIAVVGSVYCRTSDIDVLHNWSGGDFSFQEKVPSRIAYPEENPELEKITFGYEVTAKMKSYTWMKLLLSVGKNVENTHLGTKAVHGMLELPPGKSPEEVVTDYFRCLYAHIMQYLAEETPGVMLEDRNLEFILTTPSCWDDEANKATHDCAKNAGIGTRANDSLRIMKEPVAALLANLSTSIEKREGFYEVRFSSHAGIIFNYVLRYIAESDIDRHERLCYRHWWRDNRHKHHDDPASQSTEDQRSLCWDRLVAAPRDWCTFSD
jgi:hypothetical protein